jgi:hypothetical protein
VHRADVSCVVHQELGHLGGKHHFAEKYTVLFITCLLPPPGGIAGCEGLQKPSALLCLMPPRPWPLPLDFHVRLGLSNSVSRAYQRRDAVECLGLFSVGLWVLLSRRQRPGNLTVRRASLIRLRRPLGMSASVVGVLAVESHDRHGHEVKHWAEAGS